MKQIASVKNLKKEIETIRAEKEKKEELEHPIVNAMVKFKDIFLMISPFAAIGLTIITKNTGFLITAGLTTILEGFNLVANNYSNKRSYLRGKKISDEEHERFFNKNYLYQLENQKDETIYIKLDSESNKPLELDKNETKERIIFELNRYYEAYKLPKFYLNERERNELINKTYLFFLKNNIEKKYYSYMSAIFRLTLARALEEQYSEIKLYDILYNLSYLNLWEKKLSLESVRELQEDLNKINIFDFKKLKRENI